MPTYEYRCTQCDHVFDCVQRVGDPAPACPRCSSPTRKLFSSVGLIFKGKGFHSTDYRKPAPVDGERTAGSKDTAAAKDTTGPNAASQGQATSGAPEKGTSASKDTSPPTKDAPAPKGGASSSASDS